MAERGEYKLLGDQPTAENDSLGFARIAGDLAELVLSSHASTPFTVGIEGTWGQGKSSLMERVEAELKRRAPAGRVETVKFNAWTAGDGDVLEGLVRSVINRIDSRILRKAARKKKLSASLRAVATGGAHFARVGPVVDRLWEAIESDPTARNDMHQLMRSAMREWRKDHEDRLLVVFVEDLDRCSPDNVLQVFEAMKLYLDAPGLVFVVGLDAGIVSHAVLQKKSFSKEVTGDRYLEKVIQIRYRIPPAGDEQGAALLDQYLSQSGTTELFDAAARELVIERNAYNPRRIKRFINSFILEHRTGDEWSESELGAEVLIRMLILDFYFRDFAELLRDRDERRDPIGEYLSYRAAREYVRKPARSLGERPFRIEPLFESYGLPTPDDSDGAGALLADLERQLPEPIVALGGDPKFASLVEGMGDKQAVDDLRARLQRRSIIAGLVADDIADAQDVTSIGVAGMEILWIDDDHSRNETEISALTRSGALVQLANGYNDAAVYLSDAEVDVIVSNITREGDDDAGFADLERLRDQAGYDGPAIFYVARVSSYRRARALHMSARVTSKRGELYLLLTSLAGRTLQERAPAVDSADTDG